MSASSPSDELSPGYLEEYCGDRLLASNTIMMVIATAMLVLRLYARSLRDVSRGWDDFLLLPSWCFLTGLGAAIYAIIPLGGTGTHVEAVIRDQPEKLARYSQLIYAVDCLYMTTILLSKTSVVILYLRIFIRKLDRILCWLTIAFIVCTWIATLIATQLQCTPLAYLWDKTIQGGHCFNIVLWYKLTNFPNIAGDVAIMLLPIRTVWTLKASATRKAGIATVCLTGSIGVIAACVRTREFFVIGEGVLTDPTWTSVALLVWTIVEGGMYFSAACLVGLRPLYARAGKWFSNHMMVNDRGIQGFGVSSQYWKAMPLKVFKWHEGPTRLGSMEYDSRLSTTVVSRPENGKWPRKAGGSGHGSGTEKEKVGRNTEIRVDTDIEINSTGITDREEVIDDRGFRI